MTPLILAASAGREKVVNTLLAEGANVNLTTVDGHSALQYAASKNWKSICVALLEKYADINITDKRGATPMHRAASKGNIAIVKLLIEYGKDLKIGPVLFDDFCLNINNESHRMLMYERYVDHLF